MPIAFCFTAYLDTLFAWRIDKPDAKRRLAIGVEGEFTFPAIRRNGIRICFITERREARDNRAKDR